MHIAHFAFGQRKPFDASQHGVRFGDGNTRQVDAPLLERMVKGAKIRNVGTIMTTIELVSDKLTPGKNLPQRRQTSQLSISDFEHSCRGNAPTSEERRVLKCTRRFDANVDAERCICNLKSKR